MKSKDRWVSSKTCIYNIGYHIIWCPKYRRKVLNNGVDKRLKCLINEKCDELNCLVCDLEVMDDHVHLFVKTTPTIGPHFLIQQIKGYSARILREEFPDLRKNFLICGHALIILNLLDTYQKKQ